MEALARDEEIIGTRLERTVQRVDKVQVTRRMCYESNILRVQGIEYMLKDHFDKILIRVSDLIQAFRISLENLESAMQSIAGIVFSIRVRVILTLARYTIGWSRKNLEHQFQKTKVWKDNEIRIQI